MRRLVLLAAFNVLCLAGAAWLFWAEDMRYSLPTPQPAGVVAIAPGTRLALPDRVPLAREGLTFVHVFNPDCPCSRFNASHMRELVDAFGDRVHFVAVAQGVEDDAQAIERARELDLPMIAIADADSTVAHAAGVWSTPQAAIVDADGTLLWRGNYNSSRYHHDRNNEYARLAVEALLAERDDDALRSAAALRAWGCALPADEAAP